MITWEGGASAALADSSTVVDIGNILADNYAKLSKKFNGKKLDLLYQKLTGNSEATIDTVKALATAGANSKTFRANNSNKDLILTFGGIEWTATELFIDKNGNVCLDLFMADSTAETYAFSGNYVGKYSTCETYPSNMYGTSYMSAVVLNNGGAYATSGTATTTAQQSADNPFAIFTMSESDVSGSVRKFIVQAKDTYQNGNDISSITINSNPNYPWNYVINHDLSTPTISSCDIVDEVKSCYITGKESYYYAWGDDYIWIPSYSETGRLGVDGNSGKFLGRWELSDNQLFATNTYYLRSVVVRTIGNIDEGYSKVRALASNGYAVHFSTDDATNVSIRPAIHLNLTEAEKSKTTIYDPKDVTVVYNGAQQSITTANAIDPANNECWYDEDAMTITYNESARVNAKEYIATITLKDEIYSFKNSSDRTKTIKFTIKPKELEIPSSPVNTPKYNGGDISFPIGAYTADWNDNVEIVKPDAVNYGDGVIKVKNAGTYSVKAKITSNNFCWAGTSDSATPDRGEKPINVTVLPKDLIINFVSSVDGKFNISVGESITFTAVPSESDIVTGDTVIPTLTYYKGSDTSNVTTVKGAELDASELPVGTYTLSAKLENKEGTANSNYVISTTPTKVITVGSKVITIDNVTWQYEQDNEHTPISGNSVELTYNGKEFTFTVKETTEELRAKGVKVDSYSGNVQTNATKNAVTVSVKLVPYDESFEFESNGAEKVTEKVFSLTVTINKAKIDFNKLVWSAAPTNQLEYTGNTQTVTIVSGLPSFYDVQYRNNSGLLVDTYETKILSIMPKNDPESKAMADNYSIEDSEYLNYTYTWEIVTKKIEAKWTNVEYTTPDGKTVYIPEITGADAGVLKYEYTTDPDGEIKELSEILSSYSETKISYYKVTVTIDSAYATSYELVNSAFVVQPSASKNFAVGNNKKSVTVSIQETKVYFNNQPQAVKLSYTGEGIILGDFAVEYKLLNADGSEGEATNIAPSAVGKYKVTITLQGEKANTHIIVGENVFEYVIAHKDRFILTEAAAASHPYKFLYEDFHEYEQDIKEYLYNAENAESVVYIAHLAFEDTLADLLKQFANAEDITAWGADGTLIEDMTTVLATGMMLRMMDGDTVLNQLTISVMGDIDGDGDIGTADKARLNSYTLGNLELKGANLLSCDLDGDGEVGTADKARLNAYTLGNLDIYVGLTLRATAQATSEAVSACDEPAVVTLVQTLCSASESAVSASIDESESVYETSVVTTCEIAIDVATEENEITSAYTAVADIKPSIVYITSIYTNRKQRVYLLD